MLVSMRLVTLTSWLGRLVALLISVTFVFAAMACAQNCGPGEDILCAAEISQEEDVSEPANPEESELAAHTCFGCHVHLIRQESQTAPDPALCDTDVMPITAEACPSPPVDLFRPPRV